MFKNRLIQIIVITQVLTINVHAGVDFAMTTSEDYYAGFKLPIFTSAPEARQWAKITPYEDQWYRLLMRKIRDLEIQAVYHYDHTPANFQERHVLNAAAIVVERAYYEDALVIMLGKKTVGSAFYAGSEPIKEDK